MKEHTYSCTSGMGSSKQVPISTAHKSSYCQAKEPSDPPPAWVIAGDLSNTCGTPREHLENTPMDFVRLKAGEPRAVVYSCLEKQKVNFSSWLPTGVDLPGQRLVCKAFCPFPGYTTWAGSETTELRSRMKAVSGLSWGCFTATKLPWPQQCSHKQEEIPPWVAEYGFSQRIYFSCLVLLFSVPTFIFPGKFCRLVCGCTLLSFLSSFSCYHKLDQVQKTIASHSPCVIDGTDMCNKTEQKQVLLPGSFETSKYPGDILQHPVQLSACWLACTETAPCSLRAKVKQISTLHTQRPAWAKAALFYKPLHDPGFCNRWAILFGAFPPKIWSCRSDS